MEIDKKNWIAPNQDLLPDFIIGGAMKCGTTTLHDILNAHPEVYIPPREIHFFDMDNVLQHPDFNELFTSGWVDQFIHKNPKKFWNWYEERYKNRNEAVLGEDSTTYLASPLAAQRIALQEKEIKLIFLLRNPTKRTFSQYIHDLRKGRMTHNFENTLRYTPHSIVCRSMYNLQLERYYRLIPHDRIKVIVFEEFIQKKKETIREVCEFLELDFDKIPKTSFETHSNVAKMPWSLTLQYLKNRLVRSMGSKNYGSYLPNNPNALHIKDLLPALIHYLHLVLNPCIFTKKPEIKESTEQFLDDYFRIQLQDLDQITDRNILKHWF